MDLDVDVQLVILEQLDFSDLISMADTNRQFYSLAENVYRRKHFKNWVNILDPVLTQRKKTRKYDDHLNIYNFDTALLFLKHFGHLISKLGITYTDFMRHTDSTEINQAINLYCSKTLIHLQINILRSFKDDHDCFFKSMIKPFERLEVLSIGGRFKSLTSSNLSFAELFPTVRRLSLEYVMVLDKSSINCKLPNLEYLHMDISQHKLERPPKRFLEDDVVQFLKHNSHIKSLTLGYCNRPFIKVACDILSKLESLELSHYSYYPVWDDGRDIYIKNVKKLTLDAPSNGIAPMNVIFEDLEEFHFDGQTNQRGSWIDFVKLHRHLKKLYVKSGFIISAEIEQFTALELKLEEIFLICGIDVMDDLILNFIRRNQQMKSIHLIGHQPINSFTTIANILRDEYGNKWTIIESETDILIQSNEINTN